MRCDDRRTNDRGRSGPDPVIRRSRGSRGGLRSERRHGRQLPAPSRGGAARTARRPADVHRGALDDGDPAPAPVGEPRRALAFPGRRSHGGARPRLNASCAGLERPPHSRAALSGKRLVRGSPQGHRGRRPALRPLRLRRQRRAARRVPFSAPGAARRLSPGSGADSDHNDPRSGRRGGADLLRLPHLPPPTRRRSRRVGGRDAGERAPRARSPHAPHRRARAGSRRGWSPRRQDLRRRLWRAEGRGAVRPRRRWAPDRAPPRRRLPLRPGLCARR